MLQRYLLNMSKLYIQKDIRVNNQQIYVNSEQDFQADDVDGFASFIKSAYKTYKLDYPKFYKMDALCRLGFVAAELLLKDTDLSQFEPNEIGLIIINKSSSLHTDVAYQNSIKDIPSPATFVYTLPNIVIGEICIKNNIRGESLFLVDEEYNPAALVANLDILFKTTQTKICITGWIEMAMDDSYNAKLYLVAPKETTREFNLDNLTKN